MIDKELFAQTMSALADRFNRPLAGPTLKAYYHALSAELSEDDFRAAVNIAFRDCTFWPSPKDLIEFVHPEPDLDLEGSLKFDQVRAAGKNQPGFGMQWKRTDVMLCGEPALAAFASIGGNERMRSMQGDDIAWARREFITAYKAAIMQNAKTARASEAKKLIASIPRQRMVPPQPTAAEEATVA